MRTSSILSLLLLTSLCACSGGELVGVHLTLDADGSGTMTTRALMPIAKATDAENRAKGVNWTIRAGLVSSQGTFSEVGTVTLGDGEVTFSPQLDGDRPGLRVNIQRGPGAKWIETLVPDQKTRKEMAKAYDPSGRTKEIADVLRFEVVAPGNVITSGVLPTGRGVQADRDGLKATLLLPARTALEAGDAFVWDISWLRKN
ncbi:MAG: hypothetical protein ACI91B_000411 [Planctomycetota bacterium]|jgi:hypothetical protein